MFAGEERARKTATAEVAAATLKHKEIIISTALSRQVQQSGGGGGSLCITHRSGDSFFAVGQLIGVNGATCVAVLFCSGWSGTVTGGQGVTAAERCALGASKDA